MPSWGIEFGGPLNEQKIEDIVNFVETFQVAGDEALGAAEDGHEGPRGLRQEVRGLPRRQREGSGLGQPLPTFFAPDLTTEFYRLGLKVARVNITTDLPQRAALAKHADNTDPTDDAIARSAGQDVRRTRS